MNENKKLLPNKFFNGNPSDFIPLCPCPFNKNAKAVFKP